MLFKRGWCWPTEGDAAALLETSKYMVDGKLITKPLTWAQVKGAFAQAAALDKAAYEKTGRVPDAAAFQRQECAGSARRARVGHRRAGRSVPEAIRELTRKREAS